jgi:ribose/xylose/arabinose/galactoside ABC-type transport system permease subunit
VATVDSGLEVEVLEEILAAVLGGTDVVTGQTSVVGYV